MGRTPKIAVYTIALNEEKFVERWFESAKDADLLVIADTGSTDKTVEIAKSFGIQVESIKVEPWRFDVARNQNLEMIPEDFDICIQLDMDEVLPNGWREKVEAAFQAGNTWPMYKHVTSRKPDGSAHSYQMYFKIHPRKNFVWRYPIHEIIVPTVSTVFSREEIDLEVDHLQDKSKNRNSYLHLLETAVNEMPNDWRMNHYLNREYWYLKDWQKIINSAYATLKIPTGWDVERASTCMWASEAALNLDFKDWAIEWIEKGIAEAPLFFEPKVYRAHLAFLEQDWATCYRYAVQIETHTRQKHHLVMPHYWDWWAYDLAALGAHHLGKKSEAIHYGELALKGNPEDERLQKNLEYYRG